MSIPELVKAAGAPPRAVVSISSGDLLSKSPRAYREAATGLQKRLGTGFMAGLIGERGTGKTLMGVGLMGETFRRGRQARYASLTRFLMEIKATYKTDSPLSELDVLEQFRAPDFLVLDEMGKRASTDWEDRLIFELLDSRYQDMKDTLLLSNQSKEAFDESIGPSLVSRMTETGGMIICTWPSFRR